MHRTSFGRVAAIAMAIATLAGTAAASSASASTVGPLTSTTGKTAFGSNWQFGAPQIAGNLDWNQVGANTTPVLTGNLYLNNSLGISARMQIVHYDANFNVTATETGAIRAGTGALDTWSVNLGNLNSNSTHAHVIIRDNHTGSWTTVAEVHCTTALAACI